MGPWSLILLTLSLKKFKRSSQQKLGDKMNAKNFRWCLLLSFASELSNWSWVPLLTVLGTASGEVPEAAGPAGPSNSRAEVTGICSQNAGYFGMVCRISSKNASSYCTWSQSLSCLLTNETWLTFLSVKCFFLAATVDIWSQVPP